MLVVFTKNNARILKSPNKREISKYTNSILDPDLSRVKGISPHFWKLQDGLVIPMTDLEQKLRLMDIEKNGADNAIKRLKKWQFSPAPIFHVMRHTASFVFFCGSVLFLYAMLINYFPKLVAFIR